MSPTLTPYSLEFLNINFLVSNVSAQVMEFKEIGEIFVIVDFLEVRMQKFSWVYLQGVERAG